MQPSRSKRLVLANPIGEDFQTVHVPGRRWLFRLAAIVMGPLLFLLILEAGLRIAGFGHPMSFFLPMQINGKDCLIENDRFGWRFFGPEMARAPFPFVIPKVKPPEYDPRFRLRRVSRVWRSAAGIRPVPRFGGFAGGPLSRQTL